MENNISYKVVKNKFTYISLDENNNQINNEIDLYVDGKINPKAIEIVKSITDKKKKLEKGKINTENNLKPDYKDDLNRRINELSLSEIEAIERFITEKPPTLKSLYAVDEIKNKYSFNDREIITAYAIMKKKLRQVPVIEEKENVVENEQISNNEDVNSIIKVMVRKLADAPFLTKEELNQEITRISKNTNKTVDEIGSLYMREMIKKQVKQIMTDRIKHNKENISNKVDKVKEIIKANGRKIVNSQVLEKSITKVKETVSKKLKGRKILSKYLKKEKVDYDLIDWKDIVIDTKYKLINKAYGLIKPELMDEWKKMIHYSGSDVVPIYTSLNVMEVIKNGGTIKEACKIMEQSHNFDLNKRKIIDLVTTYSTFGDEFEKKTRKYYMTRPERLEKYVLEKQKELEEEQNVDVDEIIKSKISKLKELKSAFINATLIDEAENNKSK